MLMRWLRVQAKVTARIANMPWADFRDFQQENKFGPWGPPAHGLPTPGQREAAADEDFFRARAQLPAHVVVDDSPLPPKAGRRVEVRVGEVLHPEVCARIARTYARRAGHDGQVVVSVRVRTPAGDEATTPLCVDNRDGRGPQDGIGRMLIASTGATAVPLSADWWDDITPEQRAMLDAEAEQGDRDALDEIG